MGKSSINGQFSVAMLNNQMVHSKEPYFWKKHVKPFHRPMKFGHIPLRPHDISLEKNKSAIIYH